jgi:hypothetical protein
MLGESKVAPGKDRFKDLLFGDPYYRLRFAFLPNAIGRYL